MGIVDLGRLDLPGGEEVIINKDSLAWGLFTKVGVALQISSRLSFSVTAEGVRVDGKRIVRKDPQQRGITVVFFIETGNYDLKTLYAIDSHRVELTKGAEHLAPLPNGTHWEIRWVHVDVEDKKSYFLLKQIGIDRVEAQWLLHLRKRRGNPARVRKKQLKK